MLLAEVHVLRTFGLMTQGLIKGCRVMGWGWLVTKIGQEHAGLMENYHSVWFKIFLKNISIYFLAMLGLSCHMQDLHCVLWDL